MLQECHKNRNFHVVYNYISLLWEIRCIRGEVWFKINVLKCLKFVCITFNEPTPSPNLLHYLTLSILRLEPKLFFLKSKNTSPSALNKLMRVCVMMSCWYCTDLVQVLSSHQPRGNSEVFYEKEIYFESAIAGTRAVCPEESM